MMRVGVYAQSGPQGASIADHASKGGEWKKMHLDEKPLFRGAYLSLTLFLCGATVLVVEIIGARMVSSYFGSSIYVWSSLITVTLVSLALGYWLGGSYAERRPGATSMYDVVLTAAASLIAVPLLRAPVLGLFAPLGIRAGSFLAVIALFMLPLFLLGMVTPCAIGLASGRSTAVAALTGRLYAISTLGSVVGALASGFLLVPLIPVDGIVMVFAAFLAATAAVPFAAGGNYGRAGAALMLLILSLVKFLLPAELPRSGDAAVLFRQNSPYADIRVIESASGRSLLANGIMQGSMDRNGFPADRYFYSVDTLVRTYRPDTRDTLVIGLGTGAYPKLQYANGLRADVVEIDPVMRTAAMRYFGFREERGKLYVQDGRDYLRSTEKKYDCVFIDVYTAESLPIHLFTVESFLLAAGSLKDDGIIAINFHDARDERKNIASRSVVRTLQAVFRDVRAFEVQIWHDASIANTVFLASRRPLILKGTYTPFQVSGMPVNAPVPLPVSVVGSGGLLLTDAFNPLDSLYNPISETMRRATIQAFSPGLLL